MSVENFAAAAAQVKPLAAVVSLHVLGEPFMHPRLPEILGGPAAARLRDSIAAKTPMPAYCVTCGFSAPGADLGAWKKI